MGVLPNKEAGLASVGLEFAFTNDGSIPGAINRTQSVVEEQLKEQLINSDGWQSAHGVAYTGLPAGTPLVLGLLAKLAQMITGLPVTTWVGDLSQKISDVFNAIGTFSARLTSMFWDVDFMKEGPWDPDDVVPQWLENAVLPTLEGFKVFLTGGSLLDASQLDGYLPESLLAMVPFTSIGDFAANLLSNPFLDTEEALDGFEDWDWDDTVRHVARGGSATTTGNSVAKELVSNPIIPCAPGQVLAIGTWVRWVGITGVGEIFRLSVDRYDETATKVGNTIIDTINNPTSSSSNPLQANFMSLDGEFVVPEDTRGIRLRWTQTANMTGGRSYWHHGSVQKTQQLNKSWIGDLWDQLIVDGLFNGIMGLFGTGHSPAQAQEAIEAQANLVTGSTAQMMQILAALGPGNPAADDFERATIGANWTTLRQVNDGTFSITNGHDARWTGLLDNEWVSLHNAAAAGDYQTATVVLATAPEQAGDLIIIPTEYGFNDIWLRSTAFASWASRTGLRCRIGADKTVSLYWFLNGTPTLIFQDDLEVKPSKGAIFEFTAGRPGEPRRFIAKLNGSTIMDTFEIGTTSQFGPSYNRRGVGGRVERALIASARPGALKQFTAQG